MDDAALARWEVQLRKGALELAVLMAMRGRARYGLEFVEALRQIAAIDLPEGTVYPLLIRLIKDGWAEADWSQPSASEPPRKYYSITPAGEAAIRAMLGRWQILNAAMTALAGEGHSE
jgi:PadR family transcriptional regulator, regulatory protein PadR